MAGDRMSHKRTFDDARKESNDAAGEEEPVDEVR